jgi:hypothetical protein
MNDEYTEFEWDLESVESFRLDLISALRIAILRLQDSDHPLKDERIAEFRQFLQKLI